MLSGWGWRMLLLAVIAAGVNVAFGMLEHLPQHWVYQELAELVLNRSDGLGPVAL